MTLPDDADGVGPIEDLNGHTIEELDEYLDRGQFPPDSSIDDSPNCQIAIAGLLRLRRMAATLLDEEAAREAARDDGWIHTILGNIRAEARTGRSIPVQHDAPTAHLSLSEGAVRGIVRAAGDDIDGILIGRCLLDGDVTIPGAPVSVQVNASVVWGESIPELAPRVRQAIYAALALHTELNIVAVDVTITDVHVPARVAPSEGE